ncbi:MAG: tRNA 2-thiouridine(34) synthase MnmA [bacterium]
MSQKIAVAFSGGIDSAITAWILKESGNDVTAILLHFLDQDDTIQKAKGIADQLSIPFKILDIHELFNKEIVMPFVKEYSEGRTPNPCIFCNARIKCGWLLQWALAHDFRYVATGHYARIGYDPRRRAYVLKKGIDEMKDQSYFLYRLTQKQMAHLLFPLGNLKKEMIKRIAATSICLSSYAQKESQEICFMTGVDYRKFFIQCSSTGILPGLVFDKYNNLLGTHKGLAFYTIGQRKGLNLSKKGPHYVLEIDKHENKIIVGSDNDLLKHWLIADQIHFINNDKPHEKQERVYAKIRYNQKMQRAILELVGESRAKVTFEEPIRAIAPGQSVVFYDDTTILGGGIIAIVPK